jgi:hypothetical protein
MLSGKGIVGLHDELVSRPPCSSADNQVAELIGTTLRIKPQGRAQWSIRSMSKATALSLSMIQGIWNTFSLHPHQLDQFKVSPGPFLAEKVRGIIGLYLNPPEDAMAPDVDNKNQSQALARTPPFLPIGLGSTEGVIHGYVRHRTPTLFPVLEVASGRVLTRSEKRQRHFARSLTPTFVFWLNELEIWFKLPPQQLILGGIFRSVKDKGVKSTIAFITIMLKSSPFSDRECRLHPGQGQPTKSIYSRC